MFGRSDLPPPPSAVPSEQETRADPWRRWLPIAVVSLVGLIVVGVLAGQGDDEASDSSAPASDGVSSAECTTVNMRPLTGWKDPVTVVELEATTLAGETMYAWGIGDAVWIASTDNPYRRSPPLVRGRSVILPVNKAALRYDPVTGADHTFQAGFRNAALEADDTLAGCG